MKNSILWIILIFCFSQQAWSQSADSFESCLAQISALATQLGAPTNIVETSTMRVVRFPTADGSVLITCATAAPFMAVVISDKKCGKDINC